MKQTEMYFKKGTGQVGTYLELNYKEPESLYVLRFPMGYYADKKYQINYEHTFTKDVRGAQLYTSKNPPRLQELMEKGYGEGVLVEVVVSITKKE